MSTFLVPLDDLETGHESIAFGQQIAAALDAKLELVRIAGTGSVHPGTETNDDGIRVRTFVPDTMPDPAFLRWIEALEQPVVVLENAARSTDGQLLADWIIGQTGPSVTSLAGAYAMENGAITRLLIPLDGSAGAEQILDLAATVAGRTSASIGLVRIIEDHAHGNEDEDSRHYRIQAEQYEARAYLDGIARQLRQRDIQVTWEVRIGDPGDEIARAAETTAAGLVLMASHQYRGALHSVTDTTVAAANVPIIVARIPSG